MSTDFPSRLYLKDAEELRSQLQTKGASYWNEWGKQNTLRLFFAAAKRVPAYGDFLKKNGINSEKIKTFADFVQIPLTTKENYVAQYPLADLCWDGSVTKGAVIAASSGTTGRSFLWPRFAEQEEESAVIHHFILNSFFNTEQKKTLFVVSFHLGAHIAGMIIADSVKRLLASGMPGALVTPGLNKKDTVQLVERLYRNFDQVVLLGYPPFLKDVFDDLLAGGYNPDLTPIKFFCSGESFPEQWRDRLLSQSHQSVVSSIISVYGSADFGLMGHESPFTIRLRREAVKNTTLTALLGGTAEYAPPLYQTYPMTNYFEEVDGELVCSAAIGLPLIRYNIHDAGRVIPFESVAPFVLESEKPVWQLPLVSVHGRSNYTATIYALNVYPEHMREVLAHKVVNSSVTGKFFMRTAYDTDQNQFLELHLELAPNQPLQTEVLGHLAKHVTERLQAINLEYGKLYSAVGDKVAIRVIGYHFDSEEFKSNKMKHRYISKD